jgi:hypothetical protein
MTFETKRLQTLRVIWILQTGEQVPKGMCVSPKNGNIADMRWDNLILKARKSPLKKLSDSQKNALIKAKRKRQGLPPLPEISYNGYAILPWSARIATWSLGYFKNSKKAEEALERAANYVLHYSIA